MMSFNCKTNSKYECRTRVGFTMMELMFAIGIFAVGMSLVAGLFPAAITETVTSYDNSLGTIICENGLNLAKARMKHSSTLFPTADITTPNSTEGLSAPNLRYPSNDTNARLGFLIIGKQWSGRNDYTLMSVAYKKSNSNNTVWPVILEVSSDHDNDPGTPTVNYVGKDVTTFTITGSASPTPYHTIVSDDYPKLIGSIVVDYTNVASGRFATIVAVDGTTVQLDHPIGENSNGVMVFVERAGTAFDGAVQDPNPCIKAMMTRTALRQ